MGKKHVNAGKGASFQSSQGRRNSGSPSSNGGGRERNVGHTKSSEHSRVAKGLRSFFKR
ncbi:MAG: hypothetical protein WC763_00075 [Candidatus Paceibacterota bacterium]|jgi:hypothetical protein